MLFLNKFFQKKTQKVNAKIISWVTRPEGNYPIFQFTTVDGREIAGVLTQSEILPLEAMPFEESKKQRMIGDLPVENVSVIYDIKHPYLFTGSYN
jgi:hypothetical protein